MKKKTTRKTKDCIFELFCGEAISIMIDQSSEQVVQTETKVETLKSPIIFAGILLDCDAEFLYLGYEDDEVNQAVQRASIRHIELMENPLNEIMEQGNTEKKGGLN